MQIVEVSNGFGRLLPYQVARVDDDGVPTQQTVAITSQEVLLLGWHWIVPVVYEADGGSQPAQPLHSDIPQKGEVLAVGVHAYGAHMGTRIDPLGTAFEQ